MAALLALSPSLFPPLLFKTTSTLLIRGGGEKENKSMFKKREVGSSVTDGGEKRERGKEALSRCLELGGEGRREVSRYLESAFSVLVSKETK